MKRVIWKIVLWPIIEVEKGNLYDEFRFNILHKTYTIQRWKKKNLIRGYKVLLNENRQLIKELAMYKEVYFSAERSRILKKKPENRTYTEVQILRTSAK